jgi:hypothetical protein
VCQFQQFLRYTVWIKANDGIKSTECNRVIEGDIIRDAQYDLVAYSSQVISIWSEITACSCWTEQICF